jgi:hypothetical protein
MTNNKPTTNPEYYDLNELLEKYGPEAQVEGTYIRFEAAMKNFKSEPSQFVEAKFETIELIGPYEEDHSLIKMTEFLDVDLTQILEVQYAVVPCSVDQLNLGAANVVTSLTELQQDSVYLQSPDANTPARTVYTEQGDLLWKGYYDKGVEHNVNGPSIEVYNHPEFSRHYHLLGKPYDSKESWEQALKKLSNK